MMIVIVFFFFKQKTAYEMRISDWSSDVCSSDLIVSLVRDLGITAVTITHDMASARTIAHRVAMLKDGRIIWSGPTSELESSGNDYVDDFVRGRSDSVTIYPPDPRGGSGRFLLFLFAFGLLARPPVRTHFGAAR